MRVRLILSAVWRATWPMLATMGVGMGLLFGIDWAVGLIVERQWTQGFIVGMAAVLIGSLARSVDRRLSGEDCVKPTDPDPEWLREDPRVLAAAKAMCNMPARERPCHSCIAQTRRALWAYQTAPLPPQTPEAP